MLALQIMARNVIKFRQIESISHILSVLSGQQAHNGFPVVTGAAPALPSDQQAGPDQVQASITVPRPIDKTYRSAAT